eukprot:6198456-Pleurochrysis_carterae.AAC.5
MHECCCVRTARIESIPPRNRRLHIVAILRVPAWLSVSEGYEQPRWTPNQTSQPIRRATETAVAKFVAHASSGW